MTTVPPTSTAGLVLDGMGDGEHGRARQELHRQVGPKVSDPGEDRQLDLRPVVHRCDRGLEGSSLAALGNDRAYAIDLGLRVAPVAAGEPFRSGEVEPALPRTQRGLGHARPGRDGADGQTARR